MPNCMLRVSASQNGDHIKAIYFGHWSMVVPWYAGISLRPVCLRVSYNLLLLTYRSTSKWLCPPPLPPPPSVIILTYLFLRRLIERTFSNNFKRSAVLKKSFFFSFCKFWKCLCLLTRPHTCCFKCNLSRFLSAREVRDMKPKVFFRDKTLYWIEIRESYWSLGNHPTGRFWRQERTTRRESSKKNIDCEIWRGWREESQHRCSEW